MKRMSKRMRGGGLLAILLCALLLAGMLPAFGALAEAAGGTGSLKVVLKADTYAKLPQDARVEFTLYQIGVAAPETTAGWRINDDLSGYRIIEASTSEELGRAATALAKDIAGKYTGTTRALSGGSTTFTGLKAGVYLGVMTQGPEGLAVTPFIVTVPALDPETKAMRYDYDVTVKAAFATPTPTPTPSPTPTATPVPTDTPAPTATPTPTPTPRITEAATPTPTPTTQVSGQKIWIDGDNVHKTRPDSITVRLYADGVAVDAKPSWKGMGTSKWTYTFSGLPAVTSSGATITYTVEETPVEGYETSLSGLTITNTLQEKPPEKYIHLAGKKTWKDNEVAAGSAPASRPSYITVHLLRDGEEVESRTVTVATDWSYDFGEQPADDGYGNIYEYTVREDAVPGYFCRVDGMDIVNSTIGRATPPTPGGGTTPGTPTYTKSVVPSRKTGTVVPPFEEKTDEELEDLIDIFGYGTPLFGGLLGTGDITPLYPFIFGGIGLIAVILLVVLGRKRKKKDK